MRAILWILFLGIGLATCVAVIEAPENVPSPRSGPLTDGDVDAIENQLLGWAEGRWADVRVYRDNPLYIEIEINPGANHVAMRTYCRIVGQEVAKRTDAPWHLREYRDREIAHDCRGEAGQAVEGY